MHPYMTISRYLRNLIKYVRRGEVVNVQINQLARTAEFQGKVVVVTGGASGLGLSISKSFLNAGALVVMIGKKYGLVSFLAFHPLLPDVWHWKAQKA